MEKFTEKVLLLDFLKKVFLISILMAKGVVITNA